MIPNRIKAAKTDLESNEGGGRSLECSGGVVEDVGNFKIATTITSYSLIFFHWWR